MEIIKALIVLDLVVSGVAIVWRGATRSTRSYGPLDAICGAIEIGLVTWWVVLQ